jgi:hypothetical protein
MLWLFRKKSAQHIEGDGTFSFPVVGESNYQKSLERICGGRTEDGHDVKVTATLRAEPDNPHDRHAIAVFIDSRKVGYIPKSHLSHISAQVKPTASAEARVRGGWLRPDGDSGNFGVTLDIV